MERKERMTLIGLIFSIVLPLLSFSKQVNLDSGIYRTHIKGAANGIVPITPLRNPDRGFHLESNYFADSFVNPFNKSEVYPDGFIEKRETSFKCKSDSTTLIQLYIYLTKWVSEDIPPSGLEHIQTLFDGLNARGYKAILRFAYNYTGLNTSAGESQYWILRHLQQLKPLIEKNIGSIAVVQAGFIGAWGEWHNSPLQKDQPAKNAVINALMATLPSPYGVEIRTPSLKNAFTFSDSTYRKRAGFNNDYFTAGMHSHAPGNDFVPGDSWYKQVAKESPWLFVSGEIPYAEKTEWGLYSLINTNTTLQSLRDHHYSAFDVTQNFELNITSWKQVKVYPSLLDSLHILYDLNYFKNDKGNIVDRSVYDFVRDHLGYRLNILNTTSLRTSGDELRYDLKLTNTGFATLINPREVYLVLIDSDNQIVKEIKLNVNPRDWQPFDPKAKKIKPAVYRIKGDIRTDFSGTYKVGIWMPEPTEHKYDSRYDVRVAEDTTVYHWWDASGKYMVNIIGKVRLNTPSNVGE